MLLDGILPPGSRRSVWLRSNMVLSVLLAMLSYCVRQWAVMLTEGTNSVFQYVEAVR
jgi:hypothetical protein